MKFVLGTPIENGENSWYLVLSGARARQHVSDLLHNIARSMLHSPHFNETLAKIIKTTQHLAFQIEFHKEREGWFVNRKGGMCDSLVHIEEERESDEWPGEHKIQISKWPGGTHYFALVDGIDVEIDGKYKWNSVKQAEKAVEKFLKSKKTG